MTMEEQSMKKSIGKKLLAGIVSASMILGIPVSGYSQEEETQPAVIAAEESGSAPVNFRYTPEIRYRFSALNSKSRNRTRRFRSSFLHSYAMICLMIDLRILARNNTGKHPPAAEIPAVNGHGTARALARIYGALARGGEIDGVRILQPQAIRRATAEGKLDALRLNKFARNRRVIDRRATDVGE